ncbi:MAG: HAMP domain-containing histidine kinase [Firmicutes bacterium]|nr:HAMP domain-containing histidine kinase [Bacillota bacterium]
MKVKTRLSLYCSLIFGIIFALISYSIYHLYFRTTERAIYNNLQKIAWITAWFYLEEDELSEKEFEKIRVQFEDLVVGVTYQLYDLHNTIVFGDTTNTIPPTLLDKIRTENKIQFRTENEFCYGIFYKDNQGDFVVIAKEDQSLSEKQIQLLLWILIPSFLAGLIAIILLSRWVARIAYRPFSEVINQVNNISMHDLDVHIQSPNTQDELQELIDTFNHLLTKISETFTLQKNFVKYVSHEFKTPLASILGNLDLFTIRDRTPEEYHRLAEKLTQQILQMEKILETLIIISDLKEEKQARKLTRVDELIWEIISKMRDVYPQAKVLIHVNVNPEDEALLSVPKDPTQLWIALFNLIDNAIKYSQGKNVHIELYTNERGLCLAITNQGIGIPADQMEYISKPFTRADNTGEVRGSGIGLSLALRILNKNKIEYRIHSEVNIGTRIILYFPQTAY